MRYSTFASLLAGIFLLAAIAGSEAFELSSFVVGDIVPMPKSNAGIAGRDGDDRPAVELNFQMDRRIAKRAYEQGLTLALEFSNCKGERFWVMDIFLSEESLYQSSLTRSGFEEIYARTPQMAAVQSYIYKELYDRYSRVCVKAFGGNMLGLISESPEYSIK